MDFKELIEKHLDSLWFTALRLTKNKEDAEDLVQEASLKAYENIGSLRSENKAKAWLFKILTNTFINKYRKNKSLPEEVDVEPDFLEPIFYKNGHYFDMEKDMFSCVTDEDVKNAIDSLPIEFRTVVLLVDIEELSYKDVEDILKISSGTLASRLYRGRRLLRDALYEYAKREGFLSEIRICTRTDSLRRRGGKEKKNEV
ncbi:MAG TPA: RNA polymerase subunit sigma [Nitrospiraceae bacterium]|nr:RNA polymerase subunit sigma [Nitrospiraceae bacterium]